MADDVVWVPVLPSMRDFDRELGTKAAAAGKSAGEATAKAMADAVAKGQASVEKAVAGIEKARNREADATGKVRIAQAEYNKVVQSGEQDAAKLARAEEKLEAAKRKEVEATSATAAAAKKLADEEKNLEAATKSATTAAEEQGRAVKVSGDEIETAEGKLSSFGKVAAAGAGLIALGKMAVDAGKAFLDIGETFASVNKTLQFTTGATGERLDGMMESVKNIGKASPKSFGEIADVLAKLSQRTGLTGDDLELLTKQVMKVNAVMGEDTDVKALTASMASFGVQGKDMSATMDELFKVSRATGVGMNELAAQVNKGAPQFAEFGLSMAEAAGLMGALDQAGADSGAVLTGLNKSLVNFAKAGKAPKEALYESIGAIQKFTQEGKRAEAIDMAAGLFGKKGAAEFVAQIDAGIISVEKLTAATDASQSGIMDAAGAVPTLSSAWAMFKNNVIIALEPIATRVFKIFIDGLTWFRTTGVNAIQAVVGAFSGLLDGGILDGISKAFGLVRDSVSLFIGTLTGSGADVDLPWANTIIDIASRVRATFDEVKGGITAFVAAFKDGSNDITSTGFAGFLEQLGVTARDLYDTWNETILPALRSVGDFALDVGSAALPILWGAFETGVDILIGVGEALGKVIGWMIDNKDIVLAIAGVVTAMFLPALASMAAALITQGIAWVTTTVAVNGYLIAMGIYNTVMKVATVGTKVFAAAQAVLKAAFIGNPIGLLIAGLVALGAGLVLAYKKSETFRNIIQGAWDAIKTAAAVAWDFLKGVFTWFGDAFTWVGEKATWLWQSVISPVFEFIGNAAKILMAVIGTVLIAPFLIAWNILSAAIQYAWNTFIKPVFDLWATVAQWLWTSVLQPVWSAMQTGMQALGAFFGWVWNSLIKPAWDGLGAGIQMVWQNVIQPAWNALKAALQAVGDFFGWVWNTLVKPAWDGLGNGIRIVWENVIRPAWDGLKAALGAVGDFFGWIWNSVIKPVWDGLGAGINWVWENVIKRAFDGITSGLDIVKGAFDTAVGFIEKVWDKVRGAVAKPIKFVIDSVYNNGIRAAWNKVAGFVGLGELEEYKPDWLGAYASGTSVLPGYSPGVDNMRFISTDGRAAIDLSGGEGIARPEVVRAIGPGSFDAMNAAASRGGVPAVQAYLGGFAGGGIVESMTALVQQHFPMMTMTSGYRDSNDYHGQGMAADFSNGGTEGTSEMKGLAQWINESFGGQSLELIHNPFDHNIKNGRDVGDGYGFYGAGTMEEHRHHVHWAMDHAPDPALAGEVDESLWGRITGGIKRGLRSMVEKLFDSVLDPIGNAIPDFGGSMIGQLPRKAFDTIKDKAKEFLLGKADEKGSSSSAGGGAEQWRSMMIEAYRNQGYDPAPEKIDAWVKQIQTESGGDPNIAQQIVDVNGTGEAAGVGLGQMIPTTWQSYRDPSLPDDRRDPWAMTNAMVRYGEQRYGADLLGVIGKGHGYDQGGIANGIGLMPKKILEPERVLDPAQTAAWEALVPHLVDVEAAMEMFDGLVTDLDAALAKVPGAAFEEHSRDALDFFGLGKWGDLLFADQPQEQPVTPEPVADGLTDPDSADTVTESDRADGPPPVVEAGPRGPIVSIEQALAFDLDELVEKITREVRHAVLSDGMNGGW